MSLPRRQYKETILKEVSVSSFEKPFAVTMEDSSKMFESLVAIVTGGALGLGAAIVEALLQNGCKVCVADIEREKGEELVKKQQQLHGPECVAFIACDVSREDEFREAFEFTRKRFSKIDVVFNNAGIAENKNGRKMVEVNLIGPVIGCRLAIEYMGKSNGGAGGVVINTASLAGLYPFRRSPVYAATKYGVVGLTSSYGQPEHLEKEGIVYMALCPGYIDTCLLQKQEYEKAGFDPSTVFGGIMKPEYVAQGAIKLLKDRINGSILKITFNRGYVYHTVQMDTEEREDA